MAGSDESVISRPLEGLYAFVVEDDDDGRETRTAVARTVWSIGMSVRD